jgi:protein Tex
MTETNKQATGAATTDTDTDTESIHSSHFLIHLTAERLALAPGRVAAAAALLDEGATVPFIARYRKEATGNMDEVEVIAVRDALATVRELHKRKEAILASLKERDLLTPELRKTVESAETRTVLEDIYLPYRPKRKTRGSMARERGLAPLAEMLAADARRVQGRLDPASEARKYVDPENGVATVDDALAGARDIIAETVNEDAQARSPVRELFRKKAILVSTSDTKKRAKEGASKYRDYFEWSEPASKAPSHRLLAVFRGATEGYLSFSLRPPEEAALKILLRNRVKGNGGSAEQVGLAIEDGYRRLMAPSLENELAGELKERADAVAIDVFADNLRELLLAPPLGGEPVVGIDPGIRTGCKIVCLDAQGGLLHYETIVLLPPDRRPTDAGEQIRHMIDEFGCRAIAVGNGTGGRETLAFVESLRLDGIMVTLVNESGASVYSASETARREFPDHDLTVRGAVSIGRRLQDPLAELVKIEPKAIGVGQYQHDVDQKALQRTLDDVIASCVNAVGVDLNTASVELLSAVSGLSAASARAVVEQRAGTGPFGSRDQLLEVAGLGPKTFQQCAGFLRIREAKNPLDGSAVHPERYELVERMAADLHTTPAGLMQDDDLRRKIEPSRYADDTVGLPTLEDILNELEKPGRDPRDRFEGFSFAEGIESIEDLEPGMRLPGIVTNVTAFGAFVDVGVHQDGLVHISKLKDEFVKDPRDAIAVNRKVTVIVLEVDAERRRISLSTRPSDLANPPA